ncbi:hypothetical protein [Stigmatella hybrida]|uniref:hypothetical protein n=1 Tax=Stigmatella hybrida TaxID=394097 RepID=UPI001CDB0958|nr:hypothetical protein [Stigmatella hybrida]
MSPPDHPPFDTVAIVASVKAAAKKTWKESVDTRRENPADAGFISWDTRLSDPLPMTWPLVEPTFAFYAYARGMNPMRLRDGEFVGPTWARITWSTHGQKLELIRLDTRLTSHGVQGVRPLRKEELEILRVKPLEVLLGPRTKAEDQQLKSYYCLQRSVGNIPPEAVTAHAAFFEWLGCGP